MAKSAPSIELVPSYFEAAGSIQYPQSNLIAIASERST